MNLLAVKLEHSKWYHLSQILQDIQGVWSKHPFLQRSHGWSEPSKIALRKSILSKSEKGSILKVHERLQINASLFWITSLCLFLDIFRQERWNSLQQISQSKIRLSSLSQWDPHFPHG